MTLTTTNLWLIGIIIVMCYPLSLFCAYWIGKTQGILSTYDAKGAIDAMDLKREARPKLPSLDINEVIKKKKKQDVAEEGFNWEA